ncbi:hypothetical protein CUMW_028730 [Citrus unshiu]|nr:hypothetical protein CUMW_028730 [Citrus unshiu]
MWAPVSTTLNPRCSCEREGGSVRRGTSSRKSSPDSMRPISTVPGLRLKRRGVLKRGIRGWRTCVGGFGTWLLEGEAAQRMAKRRLERERGRREATADMSEDLSEGEKGDIVSDVSAHGDSTRSRLPRISSVDAMETWISQQKGKKLYIHSWSHTR